VRTTEITLRDRVRALFEAFRPGALDVIEECREVYAPDVRFQDPMQITTDREALLRSLRHLVERPREISFSIHEVSGNDEEFFLTWTMVFAPKLGPRTEVDGVSHLRSRGGLITYHRDYWDLANLFASAVPGGERMLRAVLRPLT